MPCIIARSPNSFRLQKTRVSILESDEKRNLQKKVTLPDVFEKEITQTKSSTQTKTKNQKQSHLPDSNHSPQNYKKKDRAFLGIFLQ